MSQPLTRQDDRISWNGAVSVEHTEEWTSPWRLPYTWKPWLQAGLKTEAERSSGVRIAFRSDTERIACEIEPYSEERIKWKVDLCIDGAFHSSVELDGVDAFAFEELPAGTKNIEMWLPQGRFFHLKSISVSDGASVEPLPDTRPKWITYGSSITHCFYSERPTQTWPAIVSRLGGYNLQNLGFSGNCHLDIPVALTMRDLPADYLSMCVGINISGGSLSERTFRQSITGFAMIVREKHPDTPFVIMSPIISPPREVESEGCMWTLPKMREEVYTAVEELKAYGDKNVYYVDGLAIMGEEQAHLLPDNCHPYEEGDKVMGQRFYDKVASVYFTA